MAVRRCTMLHGMAMGAVVKVLLAAGANPNLQDLPGDTPLCSAAGAGPYGSRKDIAGRWARISIFRVDTGARRLHDAAFVLAMR